MVALFTKSIDQIQPDDVSELVTAQHPETETVEFKEALPCKKGQDDWYAGSATISEYARNQLLAEIVAFANAHGGYLLIGIEESNDNPRRAMGIRPVPRCADLAEKLKLQIRDCIEPVIPIVTVRGVQMDNGDSGIVLVRIPQSRLAPHRLVANRECYVRHADRKEAMTMREIQDLTIQRAHGVKQLDEIFARREEKFHDWIRTSPTQNTVTVGSRISLVPTSEIYIDNLYRNSVFLPQLHRFVIEFNSGGSLEALIPHNPLDERPIVRGTRRMDDPNNPQVIQEVHSSGLVELMFRNSATDAKLYQSWILGVFCNGILMADTFRKGAGTPDVEYAFELEVHATTSTVPIMQGGRYERSLLGTPPNGPFLYPRMSLGDFDKDFKKLVEITLRDIWNSCGVPFAETIKLMSWRT